jgi:hypothetical protein
VLKDMALIVCSVWLFGNKLSYVQLFGCAEHIGAGARARARAPPAPPFHTRPPFYAPSPDSIALVGLNCYHLVKAGKGRNQDGSDVPFFSLLKDAVADRVAACMALSMLVLAAVAV